MPVGVFMQVGVISLDCIDLIRITRKMTLDLVHTEKTKICSVACSSGFIDSRRYNEGPLFVTPQAPEKKIAELANSADLDLYCLPSSL